MPVESKEALDEVIDAWHHPRMQEALRPLITAELIAEHERQPFGQHSDALQRVLNYLGSFPIEGKLIVEHDGEEDWYVSRLLGTNPMRAERLAGPFDAEGVATNAVFRLRLAEIFAIPAN
jgi:hypothetical protein